MSLRRTLPIAAAILVLFVVAVLVQRGRGGSSYVVNMRLADASGVRAGSDVRLGGATVGSVKKVDLDRSDRVEVVLELTKGGAKLGAGASAAIRSTNLLGEKFVQLEPGDLKRPQSSGLTVPGNRITTPVDLDQVLDVLDADTRTRLKIVINEAGTALSGRSGDFAAMLDHLPPTLDKTRQVVDDLASDNVTLGRLVDNSDRVVTSLAPQRRALADVVDQAGRAMQGTADRRAKLRSTLAQAPSTLRSAQHFLGELERTTIPLAPAARALTSTAPALAATLRELSPFERAARPTLHQAQAVAPQLTRLAAQASPVVTRAVPTLDRLATLAQTTPPLLKALDDPDGIDGVLGAVEGWGRATEGRDGVGHVFRGHLNVSGDAVRSIVGRLSPPSAGGARSRRAESKAPMPELTKEPQERPVPSTTSPAAKKLLDDATNGTPKLPDVLPPAAKVLEGLLGESASKDAPTPKTPAQIDGLLDFLLKP